MTRLVIVSERGLCRANPPVRVLGVLVRQLARTDVAIAALHWQGCIRLNGK
jgi:hypothetical protein